MSMYRKYSARPYYDAGQDRRVARFVPRFIQESQLGELSNLWHLSRVPCSTSSSTRYDRLLWTSKAFHAEHPEVSETAAYKDLDEMFSFGGH